MLQERQAPDYVERAVQTAVLAAAAIITVLYVLLQSDQSSIYLLSNGLPPFLALFAFGMAAIGLVRHGVRRADRFSMVWLGFALGMLFWLAGETTWAIYSLWLGIEIPYPSVADVFWVIGYGPLLAALLFQVWPFRSVFSTSKMRVAVAAAFVLAILLLAWLIPPSYTSAANGDLLTLAISLAYPLLDVALLVVALPLLLLFSKGTFWQPFLFVVLGLALTFVADILFTWQALNGTYYNGSYIELFYHWAYLTLAYGFYLRWRRNSAKKMLG